MIFHNALVFSRWRPKPQSHGKTWRRRVDTLSMAAIFRHSHVAHMKKVRAEYGGHRMTIEAPAPCLEIKTRLWKEPAPCLEIKTWRRRFNRHSMAAIFSPMYATPYGVAYNTSTHTYPCVIVRFSVKNIFLRPCEIAKSRFCENRHMEPVPPGTG